VPHAPQLFGSVTVVTQTPPHIVCPMPHEPPHVPRLQTSPAAHAFPHEPQLPFDESKSTHVEPHSC
jgi:hypothetical protein